MRELLCGDGTFPYPYCGNGSSNLHMQLNIIEIYTKKEKSAYEIGENQIWSVPELMVLYQHQFPDYDDILCLCKIL